MGDNVWIAPIDKGSVVEEPIEEEDEDEEREKDEEEDEEDMTNLSECKESIAPKWLGFDCRSRKTVTQNYRGPLFIVLK